MDALQVACESEIVNLPDEKGLSKEWSSRDEDVLNL